MASLLLVTTLGASAALADRDDRSARADKAEKADNDKADNDKADNDKSDKDKKPKKDKKDKDRDDDGDGDGSGGHTIDNQPGTCVSGVLATDPAGDDTWAGQPGTGLERGAGDLIAVSTDLVLGSATETASFFIDVRELGDAEPAGTDLEVRLDLLVDGETFTVRAKRGALASQSFAGSTTDVTATFGTAESPDRVTITGPAAGLASAGLVSLTAAETRYSSPAAIAPLADTASGTCTIGLPDVGAGGDAS